MTPTMLVLLGLASVLAILVLIIKVRTHPFLALLLVSLALALIAGIPLRDVVPLLKDGMGGTLGGVALIVTLGAMLGAIVDMSGGARVLAAALERRVGEKRAPFALGAASFLFGIPVFVDVATIVLVPIVLAVARRMSGRVNMLAYALPTVAALLTVHVVLPPHPGIVGGAEAMKADVGLVLVIGMIPALIMWLTGQWLSGVMAKRVFSPIPELHSELSSENTEDDAASTQAGDPSVVLVLAAILLPLALIMIGTVSALFMKKGDPVADFLAFIGDSPIALLIGVLFAAAALGLARGWSFSKVEEVLAAALPATAAVILITGAGGTFGKVLTDTGVADAVASMLTATNLPILVLAWLLAAMIRAAQGSATVATLTTAPLILPMTAAMDLSASQVALVTITIGIGSMAFSHVNDSLFWVWSRYFGVSTSNALKSYTVTVTVMSLVGFVVAYLLWLLLAAIS